MTDLKYINVVGDFMSQHPEQIVIDNSLKTLLDTAEYNICNFEAPVASLEKPIPKSGPTLCQSVESPDFLKKSGFNVFLLANNHLMDYGKEGADMTEKAFGESITLGYGSGKDAFRVKSIEVNGKRIGFLSLTQREFGTIDYDSEEKGTAWIHSIYLSCIIQKAKTENDYLFIFPHAGIEHIDAPLPQWRKLYKSFIEMGADAVIASHPHVPQGWEYFKGHPIFYSLGNFYFEREGKSPYWNKSLCVRIEVSKELKFETIDIQFVNNRISIYDGKNHDEYLKQLLQNDIQYKEYIQKEINKLFNTYRYQSLRGNKGIALMFPLKNSIKLVGSLLLGKNSRIDYLNNFQCESHRWAIENYLNYAITR